MYSGTKIAVLGGTGKIGSSIVNQLLLSGYHLNILVRNKNKLDINNKNITVYEGDACEYLSLLKIVEDSSAVVNSISSDCKNNPIHSVVTSNILRSMNNFNIKRLITITGISIDVQGDKKSLVTNYSSKLMKMFYPKIISDKQKEFELIKNSNIDWTFLRCPIVDDNKKSFEIKVNAVDCPGKSIHSNSIAKFTASIVHSNSYTRMAPFISN